MKLDQIQGRLATCFEQQLTTLNSSDPRLADAMRYGVMNGGKRVRPFLVYATVEALGGSPEQADVAAVAIEMIHSYSLVHDDLPAMDNDDLRRGKPTCHIAFDEATAILAGDALLTGAFELLANAPLQSDTQRLQLIRILSSAAGTAGMVAGQSIDLGHVGKDMTLAALERMHRHKTGALIRAAVLMGAACVSTNLPTEQRDALISYAEAIGLAFQVQDDILDIESDTATLGKPQGADIALNKPTYPALLGLEGARAKAAELVAEAHKALTCLPGDTNTLATLANYIVERKH
ncbi:MAG: farnesyl diphosphate synthase [Thalassolituus sp.]|jgi:geranylgeranyl pyrophosphate synthase|uniref:Farnesyl-diphosphate synthase n=1 Tax=Thalassolituus oleivorans MIL-1 TaxID=1298593 RepID=M5DWG6_9GAMM|nr:farnesyl diphosphate synthase [Thalassolituus oleivorans]PCI49522.1 MAG: (2E,6E)-farnesyl diphosphate synthase [Oceanospirillales bacterium]PHQ88173.1 MAG: (2E,6E)-farnesyl diphosphate synthase [Thalassobium sp.]AHK16783.1 farnesyl-diphosphate synthase [Thalassolituus oleivorans R6-15]APR68324.1 (2E,6E)-farnesyl diphosphate synthase [Thalassolituus oleivorans]MBQ0726598.1 (2E,6E)-farnesyl diphosphate synthase [Thalassolituus oleivorans]|tara:strand:- start:128 stop:1003 length:876 start_codon:yes stop_codon:yes gene_type:complete